MKLTAPQRLIYDAEKYIGGSVSVMCGVMTVERPCPEARVVDAIRRIYRTNDALNLRLDDTGDEPVLYMTDPEEREIPVVRVDDVKELEAIGQAAAVTPFDLKGPLSDLRAVVYPGGYGIVLRVHHLLGDAWSMSLIGTQLNEILEGKASVRCSYLDYTAQEDAYLGSRRCERDRAFFLDRYASCPEPVLLADRTSEDYDADFLRLDMPAGTRKELTAFARENDVTETALLFGLFALFFAKYRGCPDAFFLGMPVLGRVSEKELRTVGMYVNLAPVLVRPDYRASLRENILAIADEILSVFRHQRYNYGQLLRELRETDRFSGRLYDVLVNYQSDEIHTDAAMRSTEYPRGRYPEALQLTFSHRNGEAGLTVDYIYRPSLLSDSEIEQIHSRLSRIIRILLETPNLPLKDLSILYEEEQTRLTAFETGENVPIPEKSVYKLFQEQAAKTPDAIAVVADDWTLTYGEVDTLSDRIAAGLQKKGIPQKSIVAFILPRNRFLIPTILGILKAGCGYLAIDSSFPPDRISYMLEDSKAAILLREEDPSSLLDTKTDFKPIRIEGSDPCYCIYTSGSTGKPKGTILTQKNTVNYIASGTGRFADEVIGQDCRTILSLASVSFDIFVTESLLALCNGKTVLLTTEEQRSSQTQLSIFLKKYPADVIQTTPTKLNLLLEDPDKCAYFRNAKVVMLGGEVLTGEFFTQIHKLTDARIFNVYGPTETTVWSSFCEITDPAHITIGRPTANYRYYVLDRYLQSAPIGVTGQICIAGAGVGDGYLNRPALTDEKFIDAPFGEGKMYLTGDLGYWGEDGNLVFVGRNDFQVKLNGRRIELGEIEAALSAVPGVFLAAVKIQRDGDRQFLAAYYTGTELADLTLRQTLAVTLPRYMIPQAFVHLEEMPLTVSGKIDRKALPAINPALIGSKTEYAPPETETEKILVKTAGEILHRTGIGMLDNFFDLGGDSLKAIELIARLERHGLSCSIRDVFDAVDFQALAKKLTVSEETKPDLPDLGNAVPLTAAGREIYAAETLSPDLPLYNITYVLRVKALDPARLQKAVDGLIDRYELLRAHVETRDGILMLVSEEKAECEIEKIEGDPEGFIRPFDLTKAPLLRVGYRDDLLVFDIHHLIADGSSMPLYFAALNDLYMGREPKGDPIPYKYFAHWANERENDLPYWTALFSDGVPEADLPTDHPRSAVPRHAGKTLYRQIGSETEQAIRVLGKKEGVTPFVCYLAAFSVLLARYSGKEDLVVGVPTSGRDTKNKDVPGLFVSTLPLRLRPEGAQSVSAYLKRLREEANDAQAHGQISYAELARELGANRTDKNPLFDVMFAYQREEMTAPVFADHSAEVLPVDLRASKYDFELTVYPRESGAAYAVTYDTDLYEERTILRMMDGFETILSQLSGEKTLSEISALTDSEAARLTAFGTGENVPIPEKSVYALFEEQTKKDPTSPHITDGDKKYSYNDLKNAAEKIDVHIRSKLGNKKQAIGILCDRGFPELAAIYGIVRGGNAYLPLSPDFPMERIEFLLKTADCRLVLAQKEHLHLTEKAVPIEELLASPLPETVPAPAATPDDTLYVIFTSGSTGVPKGAMVTNRSIVNRVGWMANRYFDADTVVMRKTPYTFDVSVWEIFGFAMRGFSLHILPPGDHYRMGATLDAITDGKVTDLHFVPTVFDRFLAYLEATPEETKKLGSVKHVFLSGETLHAAAVNAFYALAPEGVTLHNLYGPAECAVDVTYYDCEPDLTDPVPIGKPVDNTQIYVLDESLQPVPVGVTGQICVAGMNVGQGYLGDPERTAEKFIDDPFGDGKMYLTGDLGYWREDGELVFVGRNDFQVKLNGQRIEPGEIEAFMTQTDGVLGAAVLVKREPDRLVAFYTGDADPEVLRKRLQKQLPPYMVPTILEQLDDMPLNASGKTDRRALDAIELPENPDMPVFCPPETETETEICRAFENVLHIGQVGRTDSFYDLGGTSLQLISLLSTSPLNALKPEEFLADPTPAGLAKRLDGTKENDYTYLVPLYLPEKPEKAVVLFSYAGGDAAAFTALTAVFRKEQSNTELFYVPWLTDSDLPAAASEIGKVASAIPVDFYSHCAGSVTALQLLDRLNSDQPLISRLVVGGNLPPRPGKRILNPWKFLPDKAILSFLDKVGLRSEMIPEAHRKHMISLFREQTNSYYEYFRTKSRITQVQVDLVVSTKDPFTMSKADIRKRWSSYVASVHSLSVLNADTHYFQTTAAEKLFLILQSPCKEVK